MSTCCCDRCTEVPGAARGGRWRRAGLIVLAALLPSLPAAAKTVFGFDFERGIEPWMTMGAGARAERVVDESAGRQPALAYRYPLGKGQLHLLVAPLPAGALGAANQLVFKVKPVEHTTSLVVSLDEQGGGRWSATFAVSGGTWNNVRLSVGDFVLSTDANDPKDANGVLDMPQVQRLSIVDASAFVAANNPDSVGFLGIDTRPRSLLLTQVAFTDDADPSNASARSVDGLAAPQFMWMLFGATAVEVGSGGPLTRQGALLRYDRKSTSVMTAIRRLTPGLLSGADALQLQIASAGKTRLLVKVEQSDGGAFEANLELPGDAALHEHTLRAGDFKRSDDARRGADRLDWSKVQQVVLMDASGLMSMRGDNRLWLARVGSNAPDSVARGASPAPRPGAAPTLSVVDAPGWGRWTKRVAPIHTGPFSLVGDPSVMRDGAVLRMVYNCFDPERKRGAICQATSTDGLRWTDVPTGDALAGRLIRTRPGEWDDAHETPFMIKYKGEYLLYFVGYRDRGGFMNSFPAHVGIAVSRDGVKFDRPTLEPVLKTSPGGWDNDSISSPSVVEHDGRLVMLYTAHCWTRCPRGTGLTLMAATSTDGRNWVRADKPVLTKADFPHAKDGIAEAEVRRGPDGQYYLFHSLLYGDNGHEIGVARAPSPFGPWEIGPQPIVRKSANGFDAVGPIAPSVVFEGDRVRMWFHGFSKRNTIEIGYAEAPWPLRPR